jgi:hypothetical protein
MRKDSHAYFPGLFSLGAGFVHALAAGTHTEHTQAALAIALLAVLQCGVGVIAMSNANRWWSAPVIVVNAVAIGGWIVTRVSGISFIDGLENSESVQAADALCASLAALAILGSLLGQRVKSLHLTPAIGGVMVLALVVPASLATADHQHDHGDSHSEATSANWPRPYFPSMGIDISNVEGVTPEQERRAADLITSTQENLVRWADYRTAVAEGWFSIGDGETGYEHFVNGRSLYDGKFLDSTMPESIVYKVYGDKRILVSAMYMAEGEPDIDAPELVNFAGPLFQWHVHNDLCWKGLGDVAGVVDENGQCPPGSMLRPVQKPMIHVWIVPHPCGPFAAVEGLAEGQAAVEDSLRVDICGSHAH